LPEGEAVVFATQLVTDDAEVPRQAARQGAEQLEAARQPRDQDQGGAIAPLAIARGVVLEMSEARSPFARAKRCTALREPVRRSLHCLPLHCPVGGTPPFRDETPGCYRSSRTNLPSPGQARLTTP